MFAFTYNAHSTSANRFTGVPIACMLVKAGYFDAEHLRYLLIVSLNGPATVIHRRRRTSLSRAQFRDFLESRYILSSTRASCIYFKLNSTALQVLKDWISCTSTIPRTEYSQKDHYSSALSQLCSFIVLTRLQCSSLNLMISSIRLTSFQKVDQSTDTLLKHLLARQSPDPCPLGKYVRLSALPFPPQKHLPFVVVQSTAL